MTRAATYIRTAPADSDSSLPDRDRQLDSVLRYAARCGYEVVASYEDRGAPGDFLYHKPALKEAIRNVKEIEEWTVLLVFDPTCLSETASARHELVHKFALYGNRIECPEKGWEELEAEMRLYRREMAGR